MSLTEMAILRHLLLDKKVSRFAGDKTVGKLASLEQVRPPTMSRIVDGLARKKLIERVSSASDRRSVQIAATAAGRKLLLEGRDRRVRALAKRFDELKKKEVETVLAAAEIMKRI